MKKFKKIPDHPNQKLLKFTPRRKKRKKDIGEYRFSVYELFVFLVKTCGKDLAHPLIRALMREKAHQRGYLLEEAEIDAVIALMERRQSTEKDENDGNAKTGWEQD